MIFQHKELAAGRWYELNLVEQLANVGSEVSRAIRWKNKGKLDYSRRAAERALELMDLTLADPKNRTRLKEPCRVREALVDYFWYSNEYKSSDRLWMNYFNGFAHAARMPRTSAPIVDNHTKPMTDTAR